MAIDAIRFVFICILCPFHCPAVNLFPNGYISVEFFFILAGYYVYKSFRRHSGVGTIEFTLRKIKRFFWPFMLSLLLMVALDRKKYIFPHEFTPDGLLSQYFVRIPEFLFCQGLHLIKVDSYINVSLWFISILLFGGAILYSVLKNFNHKAISFMIPALVVMGVTYLSSFGECGLVWRPVEGATLVDCSLVRGFADMGIGVLVSYVVEQRRISSSRHVLVIDIFGGLGLVGMFLIALSRQNYDTLALFLIPMLIIACEHPRSLFCKLFKNELWGKLGALSMYMYFVHLFIASSFYIIDSRLQNVLSSLSVGLLFSCYLIVCCLGAVALKRVSEKLYDKSFNK